MFRFGKCYNSADAFFDIFMMSWNVTQTSVRLGRFYVTVVLQIKENMRRYKQVGRFPKVMTWSIRYTIETPKLDDDDDGHK